MRIAVVSDVHANSCAFRALLEHTDGQVQEVWSLGDLIGYGPTASECLVLAKKNLVRWVAGNHEKIWCDILGFQDLIEPDLTPCDVLTLAKKAKKEKEQLKGVRKEAVHSILLNMLELRTLPGYEDLQNWYFGSLLADIHQGPQVFKVSGQNFVLLHGTPADPGGISSASYAFPWTDLTTLSSRFRVPQNMLEHEEQGQVERFDNPLARNLSQLKAVLDAREPYCMFLGHAHIPAIYRFNGKGCFEAILPNYAQAISYSGCKIAFNPGSLGHPGDMDTRASYVILDTDRETVTFCRLKYDLGPVIDELCKWTHLDTLRGEIEGAKLRADPNSLGSYYQQLENLRLTDGC